jgi:hypothetical protein
LQRHNRFLNTLERTEIRNLVDSWSLTTVLFQMQDWNILICMLVNLLVCISPEGVQTSWCTNGRAMCSTSISGLPWEVRIECPKGYPEESWEEWSRTGTNPNNCWSFDGHPLVLQTPQICGAFFGAQPINDPRKEHIYIYLIYAYEWLTNTSLAPLQVTIDWVTIPLQKQRGPNGVENRTCCGKGWYHYLYDICCSMNHPTFVISIKVMI